MMINRVNHRLFVIVVSMMVIVLPLRLISGTTGKLAGKIVDEQNEPLAGANILINGTNLGSASDQDGFYYIINIPPGNYEIEFSFIGYKTRVVQNVQISADHTTGLDAELESSVIEGETVTVVSERPVVELNSTSSVSTVSREEIESIPVLRLNEIVDLQAGVVDGHFRGGRLGEVQYQINGVSANNTYDNSMSLELDRSLLQEVQVISGTFDAEYGQAMSGVVNVVLKSGSEKFTWNAEAFFGDYVFSSEDQRGVQDKFRPLGIQNYHVSLSGPVFLPQTYFITSFRWNDDDGYIYGERRFVPTDSSDFEQKVFNPTGDNSEVPMTYTREFTGLAKLTNRSLANITVEYQAIFNEIDTKPYNFSYIYNPDGVAKQHTFSIVHGLDFTHTLSANTFYTVNLRQNYYDYFNYYYEDVYDPRYDDAGPPLGDISYLNGAVVQGLDLSRFVQNTNTYLAKGAFTSQVSRAHLLKFGGEIQSSKVKFGTPGYIISSGTFLIRHVNEPPDYPDISVYDPLTLIAYGQDQFEWEDFIFRAGVRAEYFDARATIPSDLQNPANAIEGAPASFPKETTPKTSIAPRLGISYPVTSTSSLFFAYGHFYQMPPLGQIFSNANYDILDELQAGGISYGVMGNPDLKPERTIQYEVGYRNIITPEIGINFNIFYKDIRDLLGVEFISTYAAAEYARLTNIDFGDVLGFTVSLDQRRIGLFSTSVDYTWQTAMGNASDPRETATRASAGEDPRPRLIPLNWDQQHTLNATLVVEDPKNFLVSTIVRYGSGQPYTPSLRSGFGGGLESNSGRKEPYWLVDLRADKYFPMGFMDLTVYLRVLNLFDERSINGFIFNDTGSPDYSLDPVGQRVTLANPGRYYPPRRIELGIAIASK